jgi:hypothetical protein
LEFPAPDVVVDAVVRVGDGGGAGEPAVNEHSGGGVRGGERVGDYTGGSPVTGPVDQRSCRRGGQASALAGGGDGVADLDLSPMGGPLNPPKPTSAPSSSKKEMGSPRVGVVAAGRVAYVWESFGEASPSLDHGDAESFGERSVAVDQCLDPLEAQRFHSHHPTTPQKLGSVGAGRSHPTRLPLVARPATTHRRCRTTRAVRQFWGGEAYSSMRITRDSGTTPS